MPARRPLLPRSVLLTGASSGLGRALALALAARARADRTPLRLWLTARHMARLSATAEMAGDLGALVATTLFDIRDAAAAREWIAACDAAAPLDLVIANAGRSAGIGDGWETAEQVDTLVATNVLGVVNTVLPAAALMRERRYGRIVILSSLAARLPFPSTPTYTATKAFLRAWGLALRPELARAGIGLTVVSPGYVDTPMTRGNAFHMPFLVEADWAARHILRRLAADPPEIAFPLRAVLALRALSILPADRFGRLMLRRARKEPLSAEC